MNNYEVPFWKYVFFIAGVAHCLIALISVFLHEEVKTPLCMGLVCLVGSLGMRVSEK